MTGASSSGASILHAVFAMGLLTVVMAAWMSATRMIAMHRKGIALQEAAHTSDLAVRLPSSIRRVADNYNNLFEAPTLFFAVSLGIVMAGLADQFHDVCAWIFVGARVCHSLVQSTVNFVSVRAFFFGVGWIALALMTVRAVATSF